MKKNTITKLLGVLFFFTLIYGINTLSKDKIISTLIIIISAIMLVICIKLDKNNITVNNVLKCKMKHISGLPIANRMICNIIYSDNDIAFTAGNMKFKLQNSKIQDISLTNDTEIIKQTHYASSAGGAVAGGLLFGPIGALIGGRTKKKKHTSYNATNYLVITYKNNDDEISYIEFETRFSPGDAKKIVKKFKHNNANSKSEIEL